MEQRHLRKRMTSAISLGLLVLLDSDGLSILAAHMQT